MTVLVDTELERSVVATAMFHGVVLKRLLVNEGLGPQHFGDVRCAESFRVLTDISDEGHKPDVVSLAARLRQSSLVNDADVWTQDLHASIGDPWSAGAYANRLKELRYRRDCDRAGKLLMEFASTGRAEAKEEAERLLVTPDTTQSTFTGEQLADEFLEAMNSNEKPQVYPWPFRRLNSLMNGGLRRGQCVVVGGWSGNGKTVYVDQVMEHLAAGGLRCHTYINEMSLPERVDRAVSRLASVPFHRIQSRTLNERDQANIVRVMPLKVGMTDAAGWTAPEIARHIRWHKWDAACVDIVHEIAHREERDLADIAQTLRAAGKQANCILILVVHLNDQRVTGTQRPVPVQRDIRGSGMLARGADVVLFVHRDDDEQGVPGDEGVLFASKVRNGKTGVQPVVFQSSYMRFIEQAQS